ncbi:unnamed protein product [Owenia fusiformis]|uniref:Uncharacterized protein n=1 Tax=Owenia fusiformis TaxID=6347 RepID=A0A8J1TYW7_OWEFU|nr:unnamed protein product [Owenia fusiformis]
MWTTWRTGNYIVLLLVLIKESKQNYMDATRLMKKLFGEGTYDKRVIPANKTTGQISIAASMTPQQILDLDEKNQILRTIIFVDFMWPDERLVWDPSDYGGVDHVLVPNEMVWKPDMIMRNSAGMRMFFASKFDVSEVIVYSDGKINWYPLLLSETACKIDVELYPFDYQECEFLVAPWSYDVTVMNFSFGSEPLSTKYIQQNNEWHVLGSEVVFYLEHFDCCPEAYATMKFILKLYRRASFYTISQIIPCILLTILTTMVFLLPPESGEKISLGVAVWTSLVVFLLILVELIPRSATKTPILVYVHSSGEGLVHDMQ